MRSGIKTEIGTKVNGIYLILTDFKDMVKENLILYMFELLLTILFDMLELKVG